MKVKWLTVGKSVLLFILIFFRLSVVFSNAENISEERTTKTIKVLTIGNSFAHNACQYLQQITESVEGCNIIIGRANIGGCYLEKHANLIKECEQDTSFKPYNGKSLKEWLVMDNWDVVTIQQVSRLSFLAESYQPYADQICDYIKMYAPQAQIYIHETWAYAPDCPQLEGFGITSKQMYRKLRKNYRGLSKHYNAPMLRSGDAFFLSYKKNKRLDLWNPKDRFHANENGCYLAGCVWFSELFERPANTIKFVPDNISLETAKFLQSITTKL